MSNSGSERGRGPKVLLSGGCVLALAAKTPNYLQADVLIDDGVVAEVGTGLHVRDAERVDATGTIVMPGFVDTHRHAWRSLFRNQGDGAASGEPAVPAAVRDRYQPEDVYAATLIGLLGAAEAGITTVVDWSEIPPDEDLLDARLDALGDFGRRIGTGPCLAQAAASGSSPAYRGGDHDWRGRAWTDQVGPTGSGSGRVRPWLGRWIFASTLTPVPGGGVCCVTPDLAGRWAPGVRG